MKITTCVILSSALFLLVATCDAIDDFNKAAGVTEINKSVIKPAAGDSCVIGESETIRWDIENAERIKIELVQNGTVAGTIADDTENDGVYEWRVNGEPAIDYTIRFMVVGGLYSGTTTESSRFEITYWKDLGLNFTLEASKPLIAINDGGDIFVLFHELTGVNERTLHMYEWDADKEAATVGEKWIDLEFPTDFRSFSYDMALDNSGQPSVIAAEWGSPDTRFKTRFQSYNGSSWNNYGTPATLQLEDSIMYYAFGFSLQIDDKNRPIVYYLSSLALNSLTLPVWLNQTQADYYLKVKKMNDSKTAWITPDESGEYIAKYNLGISLLTMIEAIMMDQLDEYYNDFSNINTSLSVYKNDEGQIVPCIAYSNTLENGMRTFTVRDAKRTSLLGLEFLPQNNFGEFLDNKYEVNILSLSSDANYIPVIAYLDHDSNDGKPVTRVRRWNNMDNKWKEIGIKPLSAKEQSSPSIIRGTDGQLFLACSDGVKRLMPDDTMEELGFPNRSSNGTGDPSWWIAENGKTIAVAYNDNSNKIKVKMRTIGE